jgi:maltose/moltooligosaccharide transporter
MEEFKAERKKTSFRKALIEPFTGIARMPKTMRQLAWVQFFTWFSLFAMWIYSTNAVTSTIYDMKVDMPLFQKMEKDINDHLANFHGKPDDLKQLRNLKTDAADAIQFQQGKEALAISINLANYYAESPIMNDQEKEILTRVQTEYNDGADWLGVCSSIRNGVAALFAFLIPVIARYTNRKKTHMICLTIGGIGLIALRFAHDPTMIAVTMGMVGVAWASILSMPYAMLAGSLPAERMGFFMGVFNFFIVIPQIVAATILGYLVIHVFNGNTMNIITLGGATMIFSGLLALTVHDED